MRRKISSLWNGKRSWDISPTAWKEALSYIRDGKVGKLRSFLVNKADTGIYVGNLSDDALRQEKYLAVSFITLAAHAVIEGGSPEAQTSA